MTGRKIVRSASQRPTLQVEDGKVVEVEPEVIMEMETTGKEDKPTYRLQTPKGEAVYEYFGECADCMVEGLKTPIFHCISEIRADGEIGDQLAAGWNDGGTSTPLCQRHWRIRAKIGSQDKKPEYKVLEKRW